MAKKNDNSDLAAKLAIRRHFLQKYHSDRPPSVLDCCQGEGVLWKVLRREHAVASYWGVDVKPKRGRLKIDSEKILAQPGWQQDVIDVDTYGSPWRHWFALLPNAPDQLTVFLTVGSTYYGVIGKLGLASLGLGKLNVPRGMHRALSAISVSYCLAKCYDYGIIPIEIAESVSDGNARYVGIRLKRKEQSDAVDL